MEGNNFPNNINFLEFINCEFIDNLKNEEIKINVFYSKLKVQSSLHNTLKILKKQSNLIMIEKYDDDNKINEITFDEVNINKKTNVILKNNKQKIFTKNKNQVFQIIKKYKNFL